MILTWILYNADKMAALYSKLNPIWNQYETKCEQYIFIHAR